MMGVVGSLLGVLGVLLAGYTVLDAFYTAGKITKFAFWWMLAIYAWFLFEIKIVGLEIGILREEMTNLQHACGLPTETKD